MVACWKNHDVAIEEALQIEKKEGYSIVVRPFPVIIGLGRLRWKEELVVTCWLLVLVVKYSYSILDTLCTEMNAVWLEDKAS